MPELCRAHTPTRKHVVVNSETSGFGSKIRSAGWTVFAVGSLLTLLLLWRGHQAELAKTLPIEQIRVGQRVIVDAPAAALAADETRLEDGRFTEAETIIPAEYRLIQIRAEDRWPDGTLDTINVETLQPLRWIKAGGVKVGSRVPLPVDLIEMGMPEDLRGTVIGIRPCPEIEDGSGRVVLTTIDHLNRDIVELTLSDVRGRTERIRPTSAHKFYSVTRNKWLSASELEEGEQLDGTSGLVTLTDVKTIPGTHRVYNMTVQGEHLYRVASCGVLVHNMECAPNRVTGQAALDYVPQRYRAAVGRSFRGDPEAITLTEALIVHRHWGGGASQTGSPWFSPKTYVRPGNAQRHLALPTGNTAENVTSFRIPAGTTILRGQVASQAGNAGFGPNAIGRGIQIYLPDPSVAIPLP